MAEVKKKTATIRVSDETRKALAKAAIDLDTTSMALCDQAVEVYLSPLSAGVTKEEIESAIEKLTSAKLLQKQKQGGKR